MNNDKDLIKNNNQLTLFTIGHSNHCINKFIELLKANNVLCIVDVRSIPYSKYNQSFTKEKLSSELLQHGIDYIWMGNTLGGRRDELENSRGFRQDDKYDSDQEYNTGILELMSVAFSKRTAIMCSEEDPRDCHRHKIIANTLLRNLPKDYKINNAKITHIRASGKLEDASLVQIYFQLSLFG